MSEFEILRDYRQAKNKVEQVKILADLSVGVIRAQLGLKKHKKKRKPVGADFLLKT